jgi:hypothetical protein
MRPDDPGASETTRSTPDDDSPGVPGFRSWRGLYGFVLAVFVLSVIALAIFSRVYA